MAPNKDRSLRVIILDRDGVINVRPEDAHFGKYIIDPEDLEIFPDFLQLASWADRQGIDIVVATNQQGLALGKLSHAKLDQIHLKIQSEITALGLSPIKEFYICGHLANTCECRKPKPGLLIEIQHDYGLGVENFLFVGDSYTDKLAADGAKMSFIQVRRSSSEVIFAEEVVTNLTQIAEVIR